MILNYSKIIRSAQDTIIEIHSRDVTLLIVLLRFNKYHGLLQLVSALFINVLCSLL